MCERRAGMADNPENANKGYEHTGVDLRPILQFAAGLVIIGIIAFTLLWGLLSIFQRQNAATQPPPAVLARGEQERLPPEPRLQLAPGSKTESKTPDYEMKEVERQWRSDLSSYGWIKKDSGIVRIPVDEAEKLLLQRGIPTLQRSDAGTR